MKALHGFDDIATPPGGGSQPIPDGYLGFFWCHFSVVRPPNPNSGFAHGVVSSPNVAGNYGDDTTTGSLPAEILCGSGRTFDFESAYFTAAWRDGLHLLITGFRNQHPKPVYQKKVVLNTSTPLLVALGFHAINRIHFETWGGTQHPGWMQEGTHFAMDDALFG